MTTKVLSGFYTSVYSLRGPITTLSVTSTGYLGAGLIALDPGHYSVINSGVIAGVDAGVNLYGMGSVNNTGVIRASAANGSAIYFSNGGTVTNAVGGLIEGAEGIRLLTYAGQVTNSGTIYGLACGVNEEGGGSSVTNYGIVAAAGSTGVGVLMFAGGDVVNGGALDTGALIEGAYGVSIANLAGTVTNQGTILGRETERSGSVILTLGVDLQAGGAVVNGGAQNGAALIDAAISVRIKGAAGAVTNYGVIGGPTSFFGVLLYDGGSVTNAAPGALIEGTTGIQAEALATVVNLGTIRSVYTASEGQDGVVLFAGGAVTNGAASDAGALIQGVYDGIGDSSGAASVTNFGTIVGAGLQASEGVDLDDGGVITNGAASDTSALIVGAADGAQVAGAKGTIVNFGTIRAAIAFGQGAYVHSGGALTNGSFKDSTALITGFVGVKSLQSGARVVNRATIAASAGAAGSTGVFLKGGGVVINGGKADAGALISGYMGVDVGSHSRVTNYGTIRANKIGVAINLDQDCTLTNEAGGLITGGFGVVTNTGDTVTNFGTILNSSDSGVQLDGVTTRLNLGAGSFMNGKVVAGAGTVDVVSGVATIAGVLTNGEITGAGTLALSGGYSLFGAGTNLSAAAITVSGSAALVDVDCTLKDDNPWTQTGGTVSVAAGYKLTFAGAENSFAGTLAGAGEIILAGGDDAITGADLAVATTLIGPPATVTLSGTVTLGGEIFDSSDQMIIAAAGASLAGPGTLTLTNRATNTIVGASAAATLTNTDTTITGAGRIGDGEMTLVNESKGIIDGDRSAGLVIDTGAQTIINAGLIEASKGAKVRVASAVANTGVLYALGGDLTLEGAVSGTGGGFIDGGTLAFSSAFSGDVTFAGATGTLDLAKSTTYAGTVTGLSTAGTNDLDLGDIAFGAKTTATFAGSAKSGVLTVTDGTHTAKIRLAGDYLASTFVVASDGHGGTLVHDPTFPASTAARFRGAMAGFGAGTGAVRIEAAEPWRPQPSVLGAPRALIA